MADIKLTLDHYPLDGEIVAFKAPCNCTDVDGIVFEYYEEFVDAMGTTETYTFKDSHNNTLTGIGNLFSTDAYVVGIINHDNMVVHLLNADTNAYLENKIGSGGGGGTSTLTAYTGISVASGYESFSITAQYLGHHVTDTFGRVFGTIILNSTSSNTRCVLACSNLETTTKGCDISTPILIKKTSETVGSFGWCDTTVSTSGTANISIYFSSFASTTYVVCIDFTYPIIA